MKTRPGGLLIALALAWVAGAALAQTSTGWTSRQDSYAAVQLADGGWAFDGGVPTTESDGLALVRAGLPAKAYRVTSICPSGQIHVSGTLNCYFRSQAVTPRAWAPCDSTLNVTVPAGQRQYTAPNFLAAGYGQVDYVPSVTCSGTPDGGAAGARALEVIYGP